jgi:hypothetical protein
MKLQQNARKDKLKNFKQLEERIALKELLVHLAKLFVRIMFVENNVKYQLIQPLQVQFKAISSLSYVTRHSQLFALEESAQ